MSDELENPDTKRSTLMGYAAMGLRLPMDEAVRIDGNPTDPAPGRVGVHTTKSSTCGSGPARPQTNGRIKAWREYFDTGAFRST